MHNIHDTFSSICSLGANNIEKVHANETTYPKFPEYNEQHVYSKYMLRTKSVLENWMFTQGFKANFFYIISVGMRHVPMTLDDNKKSKSDEKFKATRNKIVEEKEEELVFVQLLTNLHGKEILKRIKPEM